MDRSRYVHVVQEVRTLQSRYVDGCLMYPGELLFTWIKIAGGAWQLATVIKHSERAN